MRAAFHPSPLAAALDRKVLPGLDALRAVAVMLVFGFHFLVLPSGSGSLGVMIFFVLSGFLITRLLLAEFTRSGSISLPEFYRRRAWRIFPVFYLCWAIEWSLLRWHNQTLAAWEPWVSFLYLTDYARATLGNEHVRLMNIAWSLAIEEQFYLLWPAALLWLLRRRIEVGPLLIRIVAGVWVYRAALFLGAHASWDYLYNAFDTRADALLIGCSIAVMATHPRGVRLLDRLCTSPWLAMFPLVSLAISWRADAWLIRHPAWAVLNFSLQPVFIAVLLVQTVCFGGGVWRFLSTAPFGFLARISYSVYLFHALVLGEGQRLIVPHAWTTLGGFRIADPNGHVRVLVLVAPALLLPICSYFFFESPLLRLRDRKRRPSLALAPELAPSS